jgi:hypothetical protein
VSELEIVSLHNGQFAENCYLVGEPSTRQAVIGTREEPGSFWPETPGPGR